MAFIFKANTLDQAQAIIVRELQRLAMDCRIAAKIGKRKTPAMLNTAKADALAAAAEFISRFEWARI